VRAADALSRNAASGAWRALGAGAPAALALGVLAPPVALVPGVNLPFLLSLLASRNGSAVALTLEDKKNLALLRSVAELVAPDVARERGLTTSLFSTTLSPDEARRIASIVAELAPAVAPGVRRMSGEFAEQFSARVAERTREDLAAAFPGDGRSGEAPPFLNPAAFLSALRAFEEPRERR
jgi:hypothetical protein